MPFSSVTARGSEVAILSHFVYSTIRAPENGALRSVEGYKRKLHNVINTGLRGIPRNPGVWEIGLRSKVELHGLHCLNSERVLAAQVISLFRWGLRE